MEVHASDSGGVAVEGVYAGAGVCVPDLQRSICAATHNYVAWKSEKSTIIVNLRHIRTGANAQDWAEN